MSGRGLSGKIGMASKKTFLATSWLSGPRLWPPRLDSIVSLVSSAAPPSAANEGPTSFSASRYRQDLRRNVVQGPTLRWNCKLSRIILEATLQGWLGLIKLFLE